MLKIRVDQIKAFKRAASQRFEDRMLVHLKRFAPKHSKILRESDIREVVRLGEQRSKIHGLTSERSVRLYIEMMLLLDSGFDTDPQIPWAADVLRDRSAGNEPERMNWLYDKAWDYVEHVAADFVDGAGNIEPMRFIDQIHQIAQARKQFSYNSTAPQFQENIAAQLRSILPSKCQYIGETSLHNFIECSLNKAQSYAVTTEHGITTFVASNFLLGAGFDHDPQLPWVAQALSNKTVTDQNAKIDRLLADVIDFLKRWWA